MKRKSLYLVFGILLLLGGLFGLLLTVVAAVDPQFGAGIALAFGICSGALLVPAVLLFYFYWRASSKDKVLQTVGAILRSVREIGIQDVAGKVGKTPAETEVLISESIAAGYVQGYVDPREGKFVATAWGGFAPVQVPQIVIQAPAMPQAAYPPPYAPSAAAPPSGTPESRFCRDCGSRIEKIPGQTYWQCPHCGNIQ
ncbi:MAG: hypothetical protein E6K17_04975 [Methanobacteriota archaeon]|nr:MAG: hypothetical protein E6K17_04975 [Euryarchaeota archaeon]